MTVINIRVINSETRLSLKKSLFVDVLNPYLSSMTNVEKYESGNIDR